MPEELCYQEYCQGNCFKNKAIEYTALSLTILGAAGSYFYFYQKSDDYGDKYKREWDESEADRLKNKAEDYKRDFYIAAGGSLVSLLSYFYFRDRGCKPLLRLGNNYTPEIKIEPSFQEIRYSLVLRY